MPVREASIYEEFYINMIIKKNILNSSGFIDWKIFLHYSDCKTFAGGYCSLVDTGSFLHFTLKNSVLIFGLENRQMTLKLLLKNERIQRGLVCLFPVFR